MIQSGRLLASGRDSDIFEHGEGLVLRRSRRGHSMEREARVMEHVQRHGYPAPAIHHVSADGTELVMEKVDGPTMFDLLSRRPWTAPRQASVLAALHKGLHEIPAPDWLRAAPGGGDRVLHLDLHPLNVILSPRGPVVIDWPNAARGDGALDVALTWVILGAFGIPASPLEKAILTRARRMFVRLFLRHFDRDEVGGWLGVAMETRAQDWNITDAERDAARRLVRRVERRKPIQRRRAQ